jgi:hypothetical protein
MSNLHSHSATTGCGYPHSFRKDQKIADFLSEILPEDNRAYDAKNLRNYHRNAKQLINGGYKKYLL